MSRTIADVFDPQCATYPSSVQRLEGMGSDTGCGIGLWSRSKTARWLVDWLEGLTSARPILAYRYIESPAVKLESLDLSLSITLGEADERKEHSQGVYLHSGGILLRQDNSKLENLTLPAKLVLKVGSPGGLLEGRCLPSQKTGISRTPPMLHGHDCSCTPRMLTTASVNAEDYRQPSDNRSSSIWLVCHSDSGTAPLVNVGHQQERWEPKGRELSAADTEENRDADGSEQSEKKDEYWILDTKEQKLVHVDEDTGGKIYFPDEFD
ncbi:hypothetical protein F4780DRAFT_150178 [Xylariomycetidae sp. FL0641]|nr:hypothetical protein F4780DRAFT_150178 [Xylariomycetidae sp. FL0641]